MSLFCMLDRPAVAVSLWKAAAVNMILLLFSGAILLTAGLFPLLPFPVSFCLFLRITGFPCPTCGFTRAFVAFAHGNWTLGLHDCPLAIIAFVLTIAVFLFNAAAVIAALCGFRLRCGTALQLSPGRTTVLAVVSFLLLLANWIYRLVLGLS